MALLVALLVFLIVATLVVGLWWASERRRQMRDRLATAGVPDDTQILRPGIDQPGALGTALSGSKYYGKLGDLVVQAGFKQSTADWALVVIAFAAVGGAAAWLRTGSVAWGILAMPLAAAIPACYLAYRRHRRLTLFGAQLPEALDMLARAIRAGNALSGAIRLVGEEMPDPIGEEFRQVSEEIRLGMEPSESLSRLQYRVPVEDMVFFCTAIRIQRGSGGNLAEVLDRLAEVIRERFKILSYARVLSAQHKWSAILVGLSPAIAAVAFAILQPTYFSELLTNPIGPTLIGAGLALEAIGFFAVWRIAKIKV
ncbi:MAG TPA: type II secretion system F family protein [Candidatus Binatia bacterium]|nr:type II secretion system F family protein [Candidatus Binatia bacterium]